MTLLRPEQITQETRVRVLRTKGDVVEGHASRGVGGVIMLRRTEQLSITLATTDEWLAGIEQVQELP